MSSKKEPGWGGLILIVVVGGLIFYGMTRAPSTSRATSSEEIAGGATLVHADVSNFDEAVLQAEGPVLVDFYADWCRPCQQLAPLLERVAENLTEGRIVKVNVENSPQLADRYDVEAIPALLVFVNGQLVDRAVGARDERDVRRLLQQ